MWCKTVFNTPIYNTLLVYVNINLAVGQRPFRASGCFKIKLVIQCDALNRFLGLFLNNKTKFIGQWAPPDLKMTFRS